jgi:hypothetical protein
MGTRDNNGLQAEIGQDRSEVWQNKQFSRERPFQPMQPELEQAVHH